MHSTSPRAAAAIAAAGVAVLLACSLAPPSRVFSLPDHGDIRHYFVYAQRTFDGQVPYRDFTLEYPPGALPVLLAAGPADHGYFDRFRALMLALDAGAIVLLVVALSRAAAHARDLAAGVLVLGTLPLTLPPDLVTQRFDLWPAFLVLLALVGLLYGCRTLGLAALSLGAVAKLYPLALVPLALLTRRGREHVRRDIALVAGVALVLVLPFALLAPRGVSWAARAPPAAARVCGSRRGLRHVRKGPLAAVPRVGRRGRAARARPREVVRPGGDGRRRAPDPLHLRRRLRRPASCRRGELGDARAEPRPCCALLLAGGRACRCRAQASARLAVGSAQALCLRSRHHSQIVRPSGSVNDFTGVNPSVRAAASTFQRVIVAPPGGGSPVTSAFLGSKTS